ncbi:MAG: sugar fermentation stimulation protein A [Oceanospirillaceae bacterium]|jgi:sugar fermentation stimulation protein A
MNFLLPLKEATLHRRYKRFLADVETLEGTPLTLHCPNTGSMKNCAEPNSRVWFWDSANEKRKYPCTWELVEVEQRFLACINTQRANGLVVEAIDNATITQLQGYGKLQTEVKYGQENSRIDIFLSQHKHLPDCYVEVKNVTLMTTQGQGLFPDAVTERGRKHLRELVHMVTQGYRAVLVYCVAHTGITTVSPAWNVDPAYAQTLVWAIDQGVEVMAYGAAISLTQMNLVHAVPINMVPEA